LAVFTPGDVNTLDSSDVDFGAGGIMLLPDGTNPTYLLAVAAGKQDGIYLLNRNPGQLKAICSVYVLCPYPIGACFCGESYFNNGTSGQVVSSGDDSVMVWTVGTDIYGMPALGRASQTSLPNRIGPNNEGGFFTSVSSNGTQAGTGIIWAVAQPGSGSLSLFAFNAANLSTLFSETAAPQPAYRSFTVPVIANGLVFVAAAHQLSIFGLGGQ